MKYTISYGFIVNTETGEVVDEVMYEIQDLQLDYYLQQDYNNH
jgi:hypothetical protein